MVDRCTTGVHHPPLMIPTCFVRLHPLANAHRLALARTPRYCISATGGAAQSGLLVCELNGGQH